MGRVEWEESSGAGQVGRVKWEGLSDVGLDVRHRGNGNADQVRVKWGGSSEGYVRNRTEDIRLPGKGNGA